MTDRAFHAGPEGPQGATAGPPSRSVVVVDDHRTFADLLQFAIDAEPGLRCLGIAYDLLSGMTLVESVRPDVVVMDYEFLGDDRDGVVATAAITARHPDVRVVLLTGRADVALVSRAVEAGASSLLPKSGALNDLMDALRTAGDGGLLVHPALMAGPPAASESEAASGVALSPREKDMLARLTIGWGTEAISRDLGISRNTCRGYLKSLFWKLGAHSQLEAVAIAQRRGLAPTPVDR